MLSHGMATFRPAVTTIGSSSLSEASIPGCMQHPLRLQQVEQELPPAGLSHGSPTKGAQKKKTKEINKRKKQLTSLGTIPADPLDLFYSLGQQLCKTQPPSIFLSPLP